MAMEPFGDGGDSVYTKLRTRVAGLSEWTYLANPV